jgi:DNA repair protein RadC
MRIVETDKIMGIEGVNHIIIAGNNAFCFKERELI